MHDRQTDSPCESSPSFYLRMYIYNLMPLYCTVLEYSLYYTIGRPKLTLLRATPLIFFVIMASLDALVADAGLAKEVLENPVTKEHRTMIAQKISGDWESLATFIGVPAEDIDDVKQEYTALGGEASG